MLTLKQDVADRVFDLLQATTAAEITPASQLRDLFQVIWFMSTLTCFLNKNNILYTFIYIIYISLCVLCAFLNPLSHYEFPPGKAAPNHCFRSARTRLVRWSTPCSCLTSNQFWGRWHPAAESRAETLDAPGWFFLGVRHLQIWEVRTGAPTWLVKNAVTFWWHFLPNSRCGQKMTDPQNRSFPY